MRRDGDRRAAVQFKIRRLATLAETSRIALFVDDDPDVVEAARAGRPGLVGHVVLADWQPHEASTPQERQ